MKKTLIATVITLGIALYATWQQAEKNRRQWEVAMANLKAYDKELGYSKEKSTALQLTIDQLKYYQDSIVRKLDETRKDLKIRDKRLQSMQYVESSFTRVDTLVLRDTLFKEPFLALDTLFGDDWYSVRLGLKYPSMIVLSPKFKSEKHIIVSTKKETVNPPKKFFLFRWFQKKQLVLNVDVVEKNPYVQGESSKYIEVIK